ncbi:hypothetical protein ACJX0J_027899, partial [Zea mays]
GFLTRSSGSGEVYGVDGGVPGSAGGAEGAGAPALPQGAQGHAQVLNWAIHRHIFYQDASDLQDKFKAYRHVDNLDVIDRLIDDAEAQYRNFYHPDHYTDRQISILLVCLLWCRRKPPIPQGPEGMSY